MDKTLFFRSCLGVFQGGGCRAAAFAGAYEEAVRRGVSFSEVAGTSAGSIVAALIGAGATPSFVKEKLTTLDFKSFVKAPERATKRPLFSPAQLLAFKDRRYVDLYFDQGFYSSSLIQSWIEDLLAELLPTEHRPISFKSLPFPTYLVSTDLVRYQAKVWSQETTPDELVSEAVRASCSIPIFFQPVGRRYIDGGVLSNLPSFVFANRGAERQSLSSKVLAFSLQSDDDSITSNWDTANYLLSLSSALVDGATQLQLALQPDVHTISISTGSVKATDFHGMTSAITQMLINNGTDATKRFFDQERLYIHELGRKDDICYDKDEFYCRITQALASLLNEYLSPSTTLSGFTSSFLLFSRCASVVLESMSFYQRMATSPAMDLIAGGCSFASASTLRSCPGQAMFLCAQL
jgi:predicted acylesterase/phospholipase RssA